MKNVRRIMIILALALCLSLMITTVASAYLVSQPTIPDPYAIPESAGAKLTATITIVPKLPGTVIEDTGKYLPVGYPYAQFGGPGLVISGLGKLDKVTLCFPFRGYNYKWKGIVSQWNSTKWVALDTYYPLDSDNANNWACAKDAGNGTFALITWYYGPPEPVATKLPPVS